jgi:phosphoserine phosphatase RsbU/P
VFCDPARLAQLFSNLLGNAISHGAPNQPVRLRATAKNGTFNLFVATGGKPIPAEARKRLFQPFCRGAAHGSSEGIGLYIAAEIAKAHGGSIEVDSSGMETRFTFRMPLADDGSLRPGQISASPGAPPSQ